MVELRELLRILEEEDRLTVLCKEGYGEKPRRNKASLRWKLRYFEF